MCTLVWYIMHWCMNWMCQTLSASALCLVISESGVYFLLQFQTIVRAPLVIPPQFVFHIPLQDILANLPVCLLTWPNHHLRFLFLTILPVSAIILSIIEQFENVSHVCMCCVRDLQKSPVGPQVCTNYFNIGMICSVIAINDINQEFSWYASCIHVHC